MKYKQTIGKTGRVIIARILPDAEMIESIQEICKKNEIETAYISTCIGSLKKISFVYALTDQNRFYGIKYSKTVEMKGPIEFLGAQGIIAKDDEEKYQIHLHAHFSDEYMNVYGGHVLNSGNIVLATIDIVINEIIDVNIKRNYHETSGFHFFEPASEE
ncbi:MAG: DNA-binding protein [Clostridiales bacterium]|nr:DNA-binding protein [Clostridiales bacterium]